MANDYGTHTAWHDPQPFLDPIAQALLEALEELVKFAEEAEVLIDDREYGQARSLEKIEADGDLPPAVLKARAAIKAARGATSLPSQE